MPDAEYREAKKRRDFGTHAIEFIKASDDKQIVWGWSIISTVDGDPYFDLGWTDKRTGERVRDHIPDEAMEDAAIDFMLHHRNAKAMHTGPVRGVVVESFALTAEKAEAFGITCDRTGWMVGVKFLDRSVYLKFKSGEYKGYSIGGRRGRDRTVTSADEV